MDGELPAPLRVAGRWRSGPRRRHRDSGLPPRRPTAKATNHFHSLRTTPCAARTAEHECRSHQHPRQQIGIRHQRGMRHAVGFEVGEEPVDRRHQPGHEGHHHPPVVGQHPGDGQGLGRGQAAPNGPRSPTRASDPKARSEAARLLQRGPRADHSREVPGVRSGELRRFTRGYGCASTDRSRISDVPGAEHLIPGAIRAGDRAGRGRAAIFSAHADTRAPPAVPGSTPHPDGGRGGRRSGGRRRGRGRLRRLRHRLRHRRRERTRPPAASPRRPCRPFPRRTRSSGRPARPGPRCSAARCRYRSTTGTRSADPSGWP